VFAEGITIGCADRDADVSSRSAVAFWSMGRWCGRGERGGRTRGGQRLSHA
jgi:hypothetical protein